MQVSVLYKMSATLYSQAEPLLLHTCVRVELAIAWWMLWSDHQVAIHS